MLNNNFDGKLSSSNAFQSDPRFASSEGQLSFLASDSAIDLGVAKARPEGFWREAGQAFRRTSWEQVAGAAQTAAILSGNMERARELQSGTQEWARLHPRETSIDRGNLWDNLQDFPSYAGEVIGSGLSYTIPFIFGGGVGAKAGTAVGGRVVGAMAELESSLALTGRAASQTLFPQATRMAVVRGATKAGNFLGQQATAFTTQLGGNILSLLDEADENGVALTTRNALAAASLKTFADTSLQFFLGGQEAALAGVGASRFSKGAVANALKSAGADDALVNSIKANFDAGMFGKWFGSRGWFTRTLGEGLGESIEEGAQYINEQAFLHMVSGKEIDMQVAGTQIVNAMAAGFIGGFPMGGVAEAFRITGEQTADGLLAPTTQKDLDTLKKNGVLPDAEALRKSNEAFDAFAQTLPEDMLPVSELVRNVSFKMAALTGKKPEEYIQTLSTIFLNEKSLKPGDRKKFMEELYNGGKPMPTSRAVEIVRNYFPQFDGLAKNVSHYVALNNLRRLNNKMEGEIRSGNVPLIDHTTDAGKAKIDGIKKAFSPVFGGNVRAIKAGESFIISRATVVRTMERLKNQADMLALYVTGTIRGIELKSGDTTRKYDVTLNERGLVFTPSEDVAAAEAKAAEAKAKELVVGQPYDAKASAMELALEHARTKRMHGVQSRHEMASDFFRLLSTPTTAENEAEIARLSRQIAENADAQLSPEEQASYGRLKKDVDERVEWLAEQRDMMRQQELRRRVQAAYDALKARAEAAQVEAKKAKVASDRTLRGALKEAKAQISMLTGRITGQEAEADTTGMSEDDIAAMNLYNDMLAKERADAQEASRIAAAWLAADEARKQNEAEKAARAAARERMQAVRSLPDVGVLPHQEGMAQFATTSDATVHGLYSPDHKLAIFFGTADAATVLHEWVHHVVAEGIMPSETMRVFLTAYGRDPDGKSYEQLKNELTGVPDTEIYSRLRLTNEGHENLANSFVMWVRDGTLPKNAPDSLVEAFTHLQKQFKRSWAHIQHRFTGIDERSSLFYMADSEGMPTAQDFYDHFYKRLESRGVAKADLAGMASQQAQKAVDALFGRSDEAAKKSLDILRGIEGSEDMVARVEAMRGGVQLSATDSTASPAVSFNPEMQAEISRLFDGVTEDELSAIYGTLAAETIDDARIAYGSDPKTADAQLSASIQMMSSADGGGRFFGAARAAARKSGEDIKFITNQVLAEFGYTDLKNVPPDIKVRMAKWIRSEYASMSKIRSRAAMNEAETAAAAAEVIASQNQAPRTWKPTAYATGSSAVVAGLKNAAKWINRKFIEQVADRWMMIDLIEYDENGPLHRYISQPHAMADDKKSALRIAYEARLNEMANELGRLP
jgi:hypothetical protein